MAHLSNRDLDLLVCLHALLEECNVTRAAERLHMGQPAMSVALSRLRAQFSDELLVRVGRDLELTPFARDLRAQVERAVSLIDESLGVAERFDPVLSQRAFTFVAPDHVIAEVWPAIARVLATAPGLSIQLSVEPAEPVASDQALLRADFFALPPTGDVMSETAVLYRDRYVAIVDASSAVEPSSGALTWAQFQDLPHAVAKVEKDFRSPIDLILGEKGFSREPAIRVTSYLQLPEVVRGTDLVAVLPARVAERAARYSGTRMLALPFGPVDAVESLWWHPTRAGDPGHRWFTERLLAELAA